MNIHKWKIIAWNWWIVLLSPYGAPRQKRWTLGMYSNVFFEPSYISPTRLWKFQIKKLLEKEGLWSLVFNGKDNVNVESSTFKPLVIHQATWNICYCNNNDNTKCSTICSCHYKYNTNLSWENLGFRYWVCLKYVTRLKNHNGHVLKGENVKGKSNPS